MNHQFLLLKPILHYMLTYLHLNFKKRRGAPGWLSQLSVWLWLRSWSHSSWVQVPRWALCWWLRACSLLQILCLPLSLLLSRSCSVFLCLSKKIFFKSSFTEPITAAKGDGVVWWRRLTRGHPGSGGNFFNPTWSHRADNEKQWLPRGNPGHSWEGERETGG